MPLCNLWCRHYRTVHCTLIHLLLPFFISNKRNNAHSTWTLRFKWSSMRANIRETLIINWEAGKSKTISDSVLYLRHSNLNCRVWHWHFLGNKVSLLLPPPPPNSNLIWEVLKWSCHSGLLRDLSAKHWAFSFWWVSLQSPWKRSPCHCGFSFCRNSEF